MVYASYKPMRQGRITRPPRREKVMEIADYLDCTLDERNDLLIAAECAPVEVYLTGTALSTPLRIATEIANAIQLPAIVINRDWRIHHLNAHVLSINSITPELLAHALPRDANLLQLLCDPRLPLYHNLINNRDSWTRMVRQTILAFKRANTLSRFEPWYQSLVTQLMQLPEFESHWNAVDAGALRNEADALSSPLVLDVQITAQAQRLELRPLLISVGYFDFDYPQVIAFAPATPDSQAHLCALGIRGF